MTNFEICELIINLFIAIGTCSATILALYFWFNDKKIKLGFHAMHAETFGALKNVAGGYLVVTITNRNLQPIILEEAGLKCYAKGCFFKKYQYFWLFGKNINDTLPKKLEHGETYVYSTPMSTAINNLKSLEQAEKFEIKNIKIVACVSSATKDILFNPEKHLKKMLMHKNVKVQFDEHK